MKKEYLVPVIAVILITVFSVAAMMYDRQKTEQINESMKQYQSLLERDHSPTTGNKSAKVTIVEFFDPACETCKVFHPYIKEMMEKFSGKIKLVMRYSPFHPGSDVVVALLEASKLQNKYWETLDAVYKTQSLWTANHVAYPDKLWFLLGDVDLNFKQLEKDMNSDTVRKNIQLDISDGEQLQVTKTPGFFVNGKPLINFGLENLQQMVKSEVDANYK